MKSRLSERQLRRFYRLLSVKMIDFDCGKLCAPGNNGIPVCCENDYVVPILFHEEFRWHRTRSEFWKRMPPKNRTIRKFIDESASYYVFSQCPGPAGCRRSRRSLNCMTFPLEPYVNTDGEIEGLMYINGTSSSCPLIGKPKKLFNPLYISNSITFWKELFAAYPEERETYMDESRKRERKMKRAKKRLTIFR